MKVVREIADRTLFDRKRSKEIGRMTEGQNSKDLEGQITSRTKEYRKVPMMF